MIVNAVQKGVLGEIENPTPKFNYTKGVVIRINNLGGELSEANDEEAIELVCEKPSLLHFALNKPNPAIRKKWSVFSYPLVGNQKFAKVNLFHTKKRVFILSPTKIMLFF